MFSSTFYGHSEGAQGGGGGRVVVVRMDSPEAVMFELGCEDVSTEPWGTCCGGSLFSATSSPGSPNGASVPRDCQEPSRRPSPAAMTHSGHSEVGDPERNFPPPPPGIFPLGKKVLTGFFPSTWSRTMPAFQAAASSAPFLPLTGSHPPPTPQAHFFPHGLGLLSAPEVPSVLAMTLVSLLLGPLRHCPCDHECRGAQGLWLLDFYSPLSTGDVYP